MKWETSLNLYFFGDIIYLKKKWKEDLSDALVIQEKTFFDSVLSGYSDVFIDNSFSRASKNLL